MDVGSKVIELDYQTVSLILSRFENSTFEKKYKKMSYVKWKAMNNNCSLKHNFYVTELPSTDGCKAPIIQFWNKDGCSQEVWKFSAADDSFGEFFYDKFAESMFNEKMKVKNSIIDNKENKEMKGFNFDFGPVNDKVRMSMYGLAVQNKSGSYVSYDAKNGTIMDVDIFNFDGSKFIWKMPVAIKDISVGDVIMHQDIPMFVINIPDGGKTLIAVDPVAGEQKEIMLTRSPFGFNFATKVINFLGGMMDNSANADNPFGNAWMMFALADNMNTNDILPFLMMNKNDSFDPTLMMLMAARNDSTTDSNINLNTMLMLYYFNKTR